MSDATRADRVAAALDVDLDRLEEFVRWHPNPTVDAVLSMAGRPDATDAVREKVAAWLQEHGCDADV